MFFGASGSDADGLIGWKIPLFLSRGAGMYPRRKQRDFCHLVSKNTAGTGKGNAAEAGLAGRRDA